MANTPTLPEFHDSDVYHVVCETNMAGGIKFKCVTKCRESRFESREQKDESRELKTRGSKIIEKTQNNLMTKCY